MKAIKIIWYLSILLIFLFNVFFEGYRIFDYCLGNYSIEKMTITSSSSNSTSKRKSVTFQGTINEEDVYFSRFDDDINELYNLYPFLSSKKKNNLIINVIKFKNSDNVMLFDDNEFGEWKKTMLFFSLYIFFSIIIIFMLNYLKMKK
jgi:hypothetical protein